MLRTASLIQTSYKRKKKEILKYGIYIFVIAVWIAYKSHNTNQWAVFTKLI